MEPVIPMAAQPRPRATKPNTPFRPSRFDLIYQPHLLTAANLPYFSDAGNPSPLAASINIPPSCRYASIFQWLIHKGIRTKLNLTPDVKRLLEIWFLS
ncbi:hypothetical protein L1987_44346 [Smallanthus sonchifolius]|uniref:Uncharacterized protein n=1 Tax=Smallanthus sonchifolius TaxID=185202 RepID=A0ACB9GQD6_9ASTR|nr:hypothetical protein L1987_44346 [Smallanthus sonchifolius]